VIFPREIIGNGKAEVFGVVDDLKLLAKTQAYNTFVRPSLEYASTVWDPHTQDNINKVESIQRRAARFVTNYLGKMEY
jgi:hypothetical protein